MVIHIQFFNRSTKYVSNIFISDGNLTNDLLNEFEKLTDTYHLKEKKAMFRSKVKWIENGEKATK